MQSYQKVSFRAWLSRLEIACNSYTKPYIILVELVGRPDLTPRQQAGGIFKLTLSRDHNENAEALPGAKYI